MKQKILVTGGLGFVGGRLCEYLSQKKEIELILCTRQQIRMPWLKQVQILPLELSNAEFSLPEGVDTIIHLASLNENESLVNPVLATQINTLGTVALLRKAITQKIRRFIYLSTVHVYASPLVGRIHEGVLTRPIHPYAITHKAAEDFVLAALDQKQIEGLVIRLSNSVGRPSHKEVDRWTLLVNDLSLQAKTAGKMVLKSTGSQKRDFVPLSDVCRCIEHFVHLPAESLGRGVFNLGSNGPSISVYDLTLKLQRLARQVFNREISLHRIEPAAHEKVPDMFYDCSALAETGFIWQGSLEESLKETLVFCRDHF